VTVTDEQHRDRAIAKLHMLVKGTWQGIPPRIVEDEAAALLQHIAALQRDHAASVVRVAELERFIADSKRGHSMCEDSWYSCPLSEEGCADDRETDCTCGANDWNAKVDAALAQPDAARPAGER
jgi:hypothetical protein